MRFISVHIYEHPSCFIDCCLEQILKVKVIDEKIYIWIEEDSDIEPKKYHLKTIETGKEIPKDYEYAETFFLKNFTGHIYYCEISLNDFMTYHYRDM